MSIRLLTLLLLLAQLAIGLATLFVLVIFVVHVAQGGPFTTTWPVSAQSAVDSFPLADGAGTVHVDRGMLALASRDWKPEFVQLVCVGIFAAGANVVIGRLKAVLTAIAAGKPFDAEIAHGLRLIGYLMFGWVALDVLDALLVQPLILSVARPAGDSFVLGGSIFRPHVAAGAVPVFRMDFHLDFLKVAVGLFALALGQAFAIGRRLAEDAEAIV
jgi:hypothetical protein